MADLRHERGRALVGAAKIAEYVWDDPGKAPSVYSLDRAEFGLSILGGQITAYSGWLDSAIRARASAGRKRPYRRSRALVADSGQSP
jgi:hypothetical protein